MEAAASSNGLSHDDIPDASPAQRLQQKHVADAAHRPMVEDVVDEEDIAHPPPSMKAATPILSTVDEKGPLPSLEKATGKQKAREDPIEPPSSANIPPPVILDTKSEDAFPALGRGSKPQAPASVPMAWGARKPLGVANAVPNGINGQGPVSSTSSSRASTPGSGKLMPASTNASVASHRRGPSNPQSLPIPGRHSERIQFAPSQLLRREQLKKPLHDVLRSINKSSKATVAMKSGPDGTIIFEGTGPVDAARQALRDVAKEVGSKVCPISTLL